MKVECKRRIPKIKWTADDSKAKRDKWRIVSNTQRRKAVFKAAGQGKRGVLETRNGVIDGEGLLKEARYWGDTKQNT